MNGGQAGHPGPSNSLRDLKAEVARPDGATLRCSQFGMAPGGSGLWQVAGTAGQLGQQRTHQTTEGSKAKRTEPCPTAALASAEHRKPGTG